MTESEPGKMPTKNCQQHMRFSLYFPNCVNPDNIAEYAFSNSTTNERPVAMKRMPQMRFSARYDTNKLTPNGWIGVAPFQLSCSDTPGDGYCMHGDFINGWYEDAALNMLIGDGSGRDDGRFITGSYGSTVVEASCTPTDRDPNNGTSDYETSLQMLVNAAADISAPIDTTSSLAVTPSLTQIVASSITPTSTVAPPTVTPLSSAVFNPFD